MRRLWDHIPALARGIGIVAVIALVVVVLQLEAVVDTVGGILQIAFFLAIALFLFLVWRERRGDLEAWSEWKRRLLYAAVVLAVVAIGLAIGYGLPESRDAFALVVVIGACAYVVVRVWRSRAPLLRHGAPAVSPEVVSARSQLAGLVVRVEQRPRVDRETATTDAGGKSGADGQQGGDLALEVIAPRARQPFPIATRRRSSRPEAYRAPRGCPRAECLPRGRPG